MQMRLINMSLAGLISALLLPQVALAQLAAIPLVQCPSQAPLAAAIAECRRPTTINVEELNQRTLMLPLSMPVQLAPTAGRMTMVPLLPTQNMPQDTVMIPMQVPVKIYSTPTSSCLEATIDPGLANSVFMMPCAYGGETYARPVQLRPDNGRLMLYPTNMNDVAGQVTVPIYVDGALSMIPLDCRTTADGITFCPRTAQGEMSIWCR